LNKAGFDLNVSLLFSYFLKDKSTSTQYMWNNFMSIPFKTSVKVEQRLVLFPVLSALYIFPIFHIFEKRIKNLLISISVSLLLFVDDGLFIL